MPNPPVTPSGPARQRSHRRHHRRLRRSDLKWLALGIAIPIPLFVGAFALAQFLRSSAPDAAHEEPIADAATAAVDAPPLAPVPVAVNTGARLCPPLGIDVPPLVDAAACGDFARLNSLLAAGARLDGVDPRRSFRGRSALHHAAARGDLAAVEALLGAHAEPDAGDAEGNTPMHLLAVAEKVLHDEDIARALVRAGADATLRNARGQTPLAALEADPRHAQASPALSRFLAESEKQRAMVAEARGYLGRSPAADTGDFQPLALDRSAVPGVFDAARKAPDTGAAPLISAETQIRDLLATWAATWSTGDADAHLALYAESFQPSQGRSRDRWAAERRQRITGPDRLAADIAALTVAVDGRRATAQFTRHLDSSSRSETDRVEMTLERVRTGWRIVAERALE